MFFLSMYMYDLYVSLLKPLSARCSAQLSRQVCFDPLTREPGLALVFQKLDEPQVGRYQHDITFPVHRDKRPLGEYLRPFQSPRALLGSRDPTFTVQHRRQPSMALGPELYFQLELMRERRNSDNRSMGPWFLLWLICLSVPRLRFAVRAPVMCARRVVIWVNGMS